MKQTPPQTHGWTQTQWVYAAGCAVIGGVLAVLIGMSFDWSINHILTGFVIGIVGSLIEIKRGYYLMSNPATRQRYFMTNIGVEVIAGLLIITLFGPDYFIGLIGAYSGVVLYAWWATRNK